MADKEALTTYAELADVIDNLGLLVRERRRQQRLSMRAAAEQMGVSFSTISRAENGADLNGTILSAVLRWLDSNASGPADGGTER